MEPKAWKDLWNLLGQPVWGAHLPAYLLHDLQDIRIRRGRASALTCSGRMLFPCREGGIRDRPTASSVLYHENEMKELVCRLCSGSLYTHEDEMKNGFLILPGGHRAGICVESVSEEASVFSAERISSIVIRVAREVPGCSRVIPEVMSESLLSGFLLCGRPASGKTTLLRDLIRSLSLGDQLRPLRVAVVDERREFSALLEDPLCTAEIFSGYKKERGIVQAIRFLAPDVLVCDEIADEKEAEALIRAAGAGVGVIASLHAADFDDLSRRPVWESLRQANLFSAVGFLQGREAPGRLRVIQKTEGNHEVVWRSADSFGGVSGGAVSGRKVYAACTGA